MDAVLIVSIVAAAIRMATPLAFAALAGALSERAGIIALGLEGMMLIGAFSGVAGSWLTGSPYMGLLFAAAGGALTGLIHALFCIKGKSNQIVTGVGINILALGLTTVLLEAIWDNKGKSPSVEGLPHIDLGLSGIPWIGPIFAEWNVLVYLLIALTIAGAVILFKTPFGIRLRAVGEHPQAVDSLGLGANKIRYIAVIGSGVLAALGGAYLSIGQLSLFSSGMVAGRGYIAVAAFVFGRWHPVGALMASLFFGLTEAIQLRLLTLPVASQFVQMIPYVCTLIVLSGLWKKVNPPAALGKPYHIQD